MKNYLLIILLIGITGCGTSINVTKKTYSDGKIVSDTAASYWSSKDVTAPSLSIDKKDGGYNLKMQADNANNSEPMKQVVEGMRTTLEGLNKLTP